MIYLTNETFESTIASGVTLVDFYADRCMPCQILGKLMPHLAEKFDGQATVAKVNTDEQQYLAGVQGIRALPTVIVFKDGKEVQRLKGLHEPEVYVQAIEQALAA